jgi:hypothetical protein
LQIAIFDFKSFGIEKGLIYFLRGLANVSVSDKRPEFIKSEEV